MINLHCFTVVEWCCRRAELESLLPDMGALVAIDQTIGCEAAVLGVIVTVATDHHSATVTIGAPDRLTR